MSVVDRIHESSVPLEPIVFRHRCLRSRGRPLQGQIRRVYLRTADVQSAPLFCARRAGERVRVSWNMLRRFSIGVSRGYNVGIPSEVPVGMFVGMFGAAYSESCTVVPPCGCASLRLH